MKDVQSKSLAVGLAALAVMGFSACSSNKSDSGQQTSSSMASSSAAPAMTSAQAAPASDLIGSGCAGYAAQNPTGPASAARGTTRVKLAGTVINGKERITRTGSRMSWVRISDAAGSCEVTFFSEVLSRARPLLQPGTNVLVTVDLRLEDETLRITAQDVVALDDAASANGAEMRVWLERTEAVEHIRGLLGREGKGSGRVVLVPRIDASQSVEIALPGRFNVTPRLAQALKVLPGVARVEEM